VLRLLLSLRVSNETSNCEHGALPAAVVGDAPETFSKNVKNSSEGRCYARFASNGTPVL